MSRRRGAGFSLVEMLLAVALLALLSTAAWGAMRTATRAVERGEALIERTNKLRVTQELLRRQISQAMAVPFDRDTTDGRITNFVGERDRMMWVSPMPGYLGRGGSYVQEVALERDGFGDALKFRHAMLNGFELREGFPDEPGPVVLLERITDLRIAYRGINAEGRLDDWVDEWDKGATLPLLVRFEVEFARGSGMHWPPLVIPVMVDPGAGGAALEPSFFTPPGQSPTPQPTPTPTPNDAATGGG